MEIWKNIEREMLSLYDERQAKLLIRFFKCGKGEYGEGDCFLGIRVPITREIVKSHRKDLTQEDVLKLTESKWHEIRLAGFLGLVEIYKSAREDARREVVDNYLSILDRGNNWDLVDVIAPKILGDWLVTHPEDFNILYRLSEEEGNLWKQRVSMVAGWMLIRKGIYEPTLKLAEQFLTHKHDLMHKATGWMLREIGKRDQNSLLKFLDSHAREMPRTMLRYAIEKLDEPLRQEFLRRK
ncbi:MAG: DNA alkylation repair protein [Muribaculaceae bacterium]|nr:DNA alkylation repair protein [Muribaculaceae bacterium]